MPTGYDIPPAPERCSADDCANMMATYITGGEVAPGHWCSPKCFYRIKFRRTRATRSGTTITCAICLTTFPHTGTTPRKFCTTCAPARRAQQPIPPRICRCGAEFTPTHPLGRYCSPVCRNRWRRATGDARRSHRSWRVLRAQVVAEETHCAICLVEVDKALRWPHPMSATADHIVPLINGGDLLGRSNARLAHLVCQHRQGAEIAHRRRRQRLGLTPTPGVTGSLARANTLESTPTTTACTGAENCAAKTGHWNRLRTLDGTPTTHHEPDGMVWNRKCPADGCPIRTYHP